MCAKTHRVDAYEDVRRLIGGKFDLIAYNLVLFAASAFGTKFWLKFHFNVWVTWAGMGAGANAKKEIFQLAAEFQIT